MALDRYTLLRQMGYVGTVAEMEDKYFDDLTGLDTIGEQVGKALDASMARTVLGITSSGGSLVGVPDELATTGTPSATTYLSGTGAWSTPAGMTPQQITDLNTALSNSATALAAANAATANANNASSIANQAANDAAAALLLANTLASTVSSLTTQVANLTSLLAGKADKIKTVQVVLQVGATYPTPVETGYAKVDYNGNLDPNLVPGIVLSDYDDWTAPG